MIPILLKIHNFQAHGESVLDFTALDKITLVIGRIDSDTKKSNGAGKTTIYDAIEWVLFDTSRVDANRQLTTESLVRRGETYMAVEFVFQAKDKEIYKVERTYNISTSKSSLSLKIKQGASWRQLSSDKKTLTQASIVEVLGFDQTVLVNSVLCKQHDVAGIANHSSTERLALIKKILNINVYNDYAEVTRKKIGELTSKNQTFITELQKEEVWKAALVKAKTDSELLKQKTQLVSTRLVSVKKKIEALRTQLEQLASVLTLAEQLKKTLTVNEQRRSKLIAELERLQTQRVQSEKKLEVLKEEAKVHKNRIIEIDNLKPDKDVLTKAFQAHTDQVQGLQTRAGELQGLLEGIRQQGKGLRTELETFKQLGVGECKVCHSQVTTEHIHVVSSQIEEKIALLKQSGGALNSEYQDKQKMLEDLKVKEKRLREQEQLYNKLIIEKNGLNEKLRSASEIANNIIESTKHAQETLDSYKEEKQKLDEEIEGTLAKIRNASLADCEVKHKGLATQIISENTLYENLLQQESGFKTEVTLLEQQQKEFEACLANLETVKIQVAATAKELKVLELLKNDFAKTIPTMILENSCVLLEKEVNRYLSTLADGFTIKINTQHKNKTNDNVVEVLDIQVSDSKGTTSFEMLSGGEKFRVAFALRIALSLVLMSEAGIRIGALFYDEPFVDLDQDGVDRVQQIFSYLAQIFDYQLAITHASELKELFNNVVVVDKTTNGSTILIDTK